jgi:hypothetical protein
LSVSPLNKNLALATVFILASTACFAQTAPIDKTKTEVLSTAQSAHVPLKVGDWQLVRHVAGEHPHFLYAKGKRSFSLFLTDTKNTHPLKQQKGWRLVMGTNNFVAFVHQDTRDAARNAIAFKYQTQRRMIVGRLTQSEMIALAQKMTSV